MSKIKKDNLWVELHIKVSPELEDAVCDFLVSELNRGVIIEEINEKKPPLLLIKAYLNQEDLSTGVLKVIEGYLNELSRLHSGFYTVSMDINHIVEEDWHEGWKRFFRPLKIGEYLIVKPSWETYVPKRDEIVIEIDPGRAFGVGTHASTRLVLLALEGLYKKSLLKKKEVLDCGTGSGILAIAAAKLGASSVTAIDIDQDAVEVARKNVHLNHCHDIVSVSNTPLWKVEGPFDVVLANIEKDTLIFLSKDLLRVVKMKGLLILSGILNIQVQELKASYEKKGFVLKKVISDQKEKEWVLMEFQKGS